jgi:hypothetical protein
MKKLKVILQQMRFIFTCLWFTLGTVGFKRVYVTLRSSRALIRLATTSWTSKWQRICQIQKENTRTNQYITDVKVSMDVVSR